MQGTFCAYQSSYSLSCTEDRDQWGQSRGLEQLLAWREANPDIAVCTPSSKGGSGKMP